MGAMRVVGFGLEGSGFSKTDCRGAPESGFFRESRGLGTFVGFRRTWTKVTRGFFAQVKT